MRVRVPSSPSMQYNTSAIELQGPLPSDPTSGSQIGRGRGVPGSIGNRGLSGPCSSRGVPICSRGETGYRAGLRSQRLSVRSRPRASIRTWSNGRAPRFERGLCRSESCRAGCTSGPTGKGTALLTPLIPVRVRAGACTRGATGQRSDFLNRRLPVRDRSSASSGRGENGNMPTCHVGDQGSIPCARIRASSPARSGQRAFNPPSQDIVSSNLTWPTDNTFNGLANIKADDATCETLQQMQEDEAAPCLLQESEQSGRGKYLLQGVFQCLLPFMVSQEPNTPQKEDASESPPAQAARVQDGAPLKGQTVCGLQSSLPMVCHGLRPSGRDKEAGNHISHGRSWNPYGPAQGRDREMRGRVLELPPCTDLQKRKAGRTLVKPTRLVAAISGTTKRACSSARKSSRPLICPPRVQIPASPSHDRPSDLTRKDARFSTWLCVFKSREGYCKRNVNGIAMDSLPHASMQ